MSIISQDNLPHTATILRRKYTASASLATTEQLVAGETGLKCWVQLASMREIQQAEQMKKDVTHKIFFSGDMPALKQGEALRITAAATANQDIVGKAFKFQVKADASAGLGVLFKAFFQEFQLPHEEGEQ